MKFVPNLSHQKSPVFTGLSSAFTHQEEVPKKSPKGLKNSKPVSDGGIRFGFVDFRPVPIGFWR
jgi:hypothetical protein